MLEIMLCSALLDLSAAFDTVDHDVLVEHLARTCGLRSTALDWLHSYLLDRSQYVFYDGVSSSVRRLVCRVPQGLVLGPLLFLLYTADVGELDKDGLDKDETHTQTDWPTHRQ